MLASASTEPGGTHDETSSSAGNGKEDDDALGSDDESDDRLDPQQHDPERLKAFNVRFKSRTQLVMNVSSLHC